MDNLGKLEKNLRNEENKKQPENSVMFFFLF